MAQPCPAVAGIAGLHLDEVDAEHERSEGKAGTKYRGARVQAERCRSVCGGRAETTARPRAGAEGVGEGAKRMQQLPGAGAPKAEGARRMWEVAGSERARLLADK